MAAMWRAKVRLPLALDSAIRDYAVRNRLKLRDLVEAMIDDGGAAISAEGGAYVFRAERDWKNQEVQVFEYVLAEDYRPRVDGLTAAMTGSGKRGKALAETLLIGAEKRGIGK